MKKTLATFLAIAAALCASAQNRNTTAVVGAVDMREARVWVDSPSPMSLSPKCVEKKSPEKSVESKMSFDKSCGGAAEIVFVNLKPNTEYEFEIGGEKGSFTTKPDFADRTPPPDFSFALLGANHVNDADFDPPFKTPGGEYEIYDSVKNAKPAFAIWAGTSNALRKADTGSKSAIYSRLLAAKSFAATRPLLLNVPNYGVPCADAYADSSVAGARDYLDAFDSVWANPKGSDKSSRAYSFSFADADFFVLDDFSNSSNLDYKDDRPEMLGKAQMKWLMGALQNSRATFKFVVMNTPIANPVESKANFTHAARERKELLDFLSDAKIEGLIFLSAKKDYGEATRLIRAGAYPIVEATSGPLTARPAKEVSEMNYFRMPSSSALKRGFVLVKVEGAEGSRAARISFFDSKGNAGFSTLVKESDLKKFE